MAAPTMIPLPTITESDKIWARSVGLIPAGTQTLAKGPGQYVKGVAPKYAKKGKGAWLTDVDGNQYLDMSMGIGPLGAATATTGWMTPSGRSWRTGSPSR